ncbi:iron chelate uptake ABC transporter, FeCT family, permease protein [Desulfitobacterium hafniense DP7]|uniref:Fe3+-siderophore ABC transporter permease n=2 Tax=Desulfitobacterium hafniense TaxID=49338 RepID=A0A0W1JD62_DESHA|nr:iron ABC transporter permease [Desulfitobacterium hafniense]EHL06731.1 iron chelate uptake ABC transporter, FeCT family, permease protein [Desulfitobacterium hafniense DP7]KTE89406.1 Fe3+-siderophore ABC transporter permease [Desulfitobacterium hafniense]MEA5023447.1 iron ABC transporter permease [Desulfitobacterium hafniense]
MNNTSFSNKGESRLKIRNSEYFGVKILLLVALTVALFFGSFLVGRYPIPPQTVMDIILSQFLPIPQYWDSTLETVVMQVRLPRIALGILVGGALSVSGASYQTLFKNPMVSPDLLGVSAGAGFGAALAMINDGSWWQIQTTAFTFGMIAVIAAYIIAYVFGRQTITILILGGVVVSSLFQSLISIIKTLADTENQLPAITFWLMGGLGKGANQDVMLMLPAMVLSLALLFLFRNQINALAAGEDEAATMGVNVPLVKLIVICSSTLMTVCSVSICGIIGWVGMVVPHIARMLTGANYSKLVATSFFIGGVFLLLIDNIIRGVEGVELPLGVLTALVGTPVFVLLLSRVKKGWS